MWKLILGIFLIIAGVFLGLYVGIWVCFIGGIVQIIEQIRAEHLVAMKVAIGLAKIVCAGLLGWLSALIFVVPGLGLVGWFSK